MPLHQAPHDITLVTRFTVNQLLSPMAVITLTLTVLCFLVPTKASFMPSTPIAVKRSLLSYQRHFTAYKVHYMKIQPVQMITHMEWMALSPAGCMI